MLLPGGRTVHNRFNFPLNMTDETSSSIKFRSSEGVQLQACKLIIWDGAPMASRAALQEVGEFLRFITGNNSLLFGKKVLVLGVLPVVPRGSHYSQVENSIKFSIIWSQIQVCHESTNMRALPHEQDFVV